jgi:hypothetical protein
MMSKRMLLFGQNNGDMKAAEAAKWFAKLKRLGERAD